MNTPGFSFRVTARRGKARAGVLTTPHGDILTPAFMPCGTQGTVKAMTAGELEAAPLDARVILGNTYHLYLRPGLDVIAAHRGLHRFAGWRRAILTDSGGFQVFSLATLNKIDRDGVTFRSHIDGSQHRLTPERSMEIQAVLRSDIAMAFDQCAPGECGALEQEEAMERTTRWAERCLAAPRPEGQALFGIVQGGPDAARRRRHMAEIAGLAGFDGYALGGFSVGEPIAVMYALIDEIAHELPEDRPRYLMGVGTPADLAHGVAAGIDLFDCVMPTRNARNGQLFTRAGRLNIANAQFRDDGGPVDESCGCECCIRYTRAYLSHLFHAKELLFHRLASVHNLAHYLDLIRRAREAIDAGAFPASPW